MNFVRKHGVLIALAAALAAAPFLFYPMLVMKVLCFALFACAFNLLLGYTGLLSFGHAAYFGAGAYITGHAMSAWSTTPRGRAGNGRRMPGRARVAGRRPDAPFFWERTLLRKVFGKVRCESSVREPWDSASASGTR